ncbi:MAG: hypothetical protein NTW29_15225 [Bacteroidetes bacterium]|nr:hypothetical protein [Bacteroidota bacterium]
MRIIFILLLGFVFNSVYAQPAIDTIKYLYQPFAGDSAWLETSPGKYILVYNDKDILYDDEKKLELAGPRCPSVNPELKCNSDIFQGCNRGNVKTTMLTKRATHYRTVAELLSVLPNVASMKARGISSLETGARDVAENENVVVEKAFLFAIYKEDDNDFHMIIGSTASLQTAVLMNIEISGLPRRASAEVKKKFKRVRQIIESVPYLQNIPCMPSPVKLLRTPIELKNIRGSLFWDAQHAGGGVGPEAARPKSAWEIHPVIDLVVVGPAGG